MSQCYSVIVDSGISAPVHDKEVDDGLNAIDKRYIYPLMYNVQLPRSKIFDSHILMYYCTQNNDFSMDKKFQKDMSKEHRKYGVIDQVKYRNRDSKIKWTYREYHVQDNSDVAHKYVKFYCDTKNSQHYHFVVHIKSLVEKGGWVSNIIYVLIQN